MAFFPFRYWLLLFLAIKWPVSSNQFGKHWNSFRRGRPEIHCSVPFGLYLFWGTHHSVPFVLCVFMGFHHSVPVCTVSVLGIHYWVLPCIVSVLGRDCSLSPQCATSVHRDVSVHTLSCTCCDHKLRKSTSTPALPRTTHKKVTEAGCMVTPVSTHPPFLPNWWMWPCLEHSGLCRYNLRSWGSELF